MDSPSSPPQRRRTREQVSEAERNAKAKEAACRWLILYYKMSVMLEKFERLNRLNAGCIEMLYRFPLLASMCQGMRMNEFMAEEAAARLTHPRMSKDSSVSMLGNQVPYPRKRNQCEHPRIEQHRTGNPSGKFRECNLCGIVYKGKEVYNPITKGTAMVW